MSEPSDDDTLPSSLPVPTPETPQLLSPAPPDRAALRRRDSGESSLVFREAGTFARLPRGAPIHRPPEAGPTTSQVPVLIPDSTPSETTPTFASEKRKAKIPRVYEVSRDKGLHTDTKRSSNAAPKGNRADEILIAKRTQRSARSRESLTRVVILSAGVGALVASLLLLAGYVLFARGH
jgi:hypothetical protein